MVTNIAGIYLSTLCNCEVSDRSVVASSYIDGLMLPYISPCCNDCPNCFAFAVAVSAVNGNGPATALNLLLDHKVL